MSFSVLIGLGMSFSNSGFVGYPIALQILGPPAAAALAMCMIVENVLMFPLALVLAVPRGVEGKIEHFELREGCGNGTSQGSARYRK